MQVLVVLAVNHKLARDTFETQGCRLLDTSRMPADVANKITFLPRSFDPNRSTYISFEKFVLQGGTYEASPAAPQINGVIVLFESTVEHLFDGMRDAVFGAQVPPIGYAENVSNYLTGNFATLLGNYGLLLKIVEDATKYQASALPLKNFSAQEFRALAQVCRERSLARTFQNEIVPSFSKLLKRRGPKRRSKFPHVYFIDDAARYFKYGFERHSRYETGGGHPLKCAINGKFRFGGELDQDRHFNVSAGNSDEDRISCDLPNCHGEIVAVNSRTHINMFSNDFHK
jgi:hypothetical protein